MQVWRYAFPFLRLTQYFGAIGIVAGGFSDGKSDTSGTASVASGGIAEGNGDLARYADDIYSQSGGVRVRDIQLRPDGLTIYKQFMVQERRAQRAFIWERLKLGNINFVHSSDTSWVTQKRESTLILLAILKKTPFPKLSESEQRNWFLDLLLDFPPDTYPHLAVEHLLNIDWNLDHFNIFEDTIVTRPHYNDKPGAHASQHQSLIHDAVARVAYNDPRYRDSDAVVNYRINRRDLMKERVDFLSVPRDVVGDDKEMVRWALNEIEELRREKYFDVALIAKELTRRGADTIDIDVNVDALLEKKIGARKEDIYKVISEEIDAQIERVYQQSTAMSAADAIEVLREIANTETQVAQTYKKFNDPTSGDLHPVLFDKTAILRANIDKVYQRSTIRRDEFHKMTEPVVANPGRISRGPTYRVHFSDPERRYVSSLNRGCREEVQGLVSRHVEALARAHLPGNGLKGV